jgi:hypothetical protein
MTLSGTTKLEAVNIILNTIGETSTSTLSGTLPFEVASADATLDEVTRALQMDSYVFNTEYEVELPVVTDISTGATRIPVPSNYLRVESHSGSEKYTIRNGYLYSMKEKTDSFSTKATLDVVFALEFVDLPEAAKRYVSIRAARVFADRMVGSKDIRAFTQMDEYEAKAKLMNYEASVGDVNMLRDSADTYSIINRRI